MLLPFLFAMKLSFIGRGREGLAEIGKERGQPAKDDKERERESYLSRTGVMKNAFFISSFNTWDSISDAALEGSM